MKGWPARNSLSPSICSDVSQFVRKKLETKVIAQIVTTILQGLLFRGLWSYLLVQVCFLVVVVFVCLFWQAEPLWILQKLQPSCSDSWNQSHPPTFPSKKRPRRTRGAREVLRTEGRDPVMPGRVPAASTKGANTPPWSLSAPVNWFQGGNSWSSISPLWHRNPPVLEIDTHATVILWTSTWVSDLLVWEERLGHSQPGRSLKLMRSPCLTPSSSPGLPSLLGDCSVILWLRN